MLLLNLLFPLHQRTMSKQPPPSAKASSFRPPPFKQKIIQSTQDALVANARTKSRDKGKGKGKERAIFGELADLLGRECQCSRQMWDSAEI